MNSEIPLWMDSDIKYQETKDDDILVTLEIPMPDDNPKPCVLVVNGIFYTPIMGYSSKRLPPSERSRRRAVYNHIQYKRNKRKFSDNVARNQKKQKTSQ